MKSLLPSFLLEALQYFSSDECNNNLPLEVTDIISNNINDIINCMKEELSDDLMIYIEYESRFIYRNNRCNPCYIVDGVRTTIKMEDCIENNDPLKRLIKSIEKLSTYSEDIAIKILSECLNEIKISRNVKINIIDHAASENFSYTCQILYKIFGIDILLQSNDAGWTALHRACYNDDVIAIETLFNTINNEYIWEYINIPGNNMEESPLFVAATKGSTEAVKLLIKVSDDKSRDYIMNDVNNSNCSLFNNACTNGHLEIVKILSKTAGNDKLFELIMLHNENAFIGAAGNGKVEVVRYLLDNIGNRKMEIMRTKAFRFTALEIACFNGRLDVVKVIIEHVGDRVKELDLNNAIIQTLYNKNDDISEYLLDILKNYS